MFSRPFPEGPFVSCGSVLLAIRHGCGFSAKRNLIGLKMRVLGSQRATLNILVSNVTKTVTLCLPFTCPKRLKKLSKPLNQNTIANLRNLLR